MLRPYQQDLFSSRLPSWASCSDDPQAYGVRSEPRHKALSRAYIDPNPKALVWAMVFDIDRPQAARAWEDSPILLPVPNWTTQNPKNGHAHLGYVLDVPVSRTLKAKASPQRFFARIQHGMTIALDADRAYTHRLTKTPNHSRWRTEFLRSEPYELRELRDFLGESLPLRIARKEAVGEGRNVCLFDGLRHWAYRARLAYNNEQQWLEACQQHAQELNIFSAPLGVREVGQIAKSVAKWTWKNITPQGFSAVQKKRGEKGRRLRAIQQTSLAMDFRAVLLGDIK